MTARVWMVTLWGFSIGLGSSGRSMVPQLTSCEANKRRTIPKDWDKAVKEEEK
jgi:hypothetical protein